MYLNGHFKLAFLASIIQEIYWVNILGVPVLQIPKGIAFFFDQSHRPSPG
jgi:hypothetical protein